MADQTRLLRYRMPGIEHDEVRNASHVESSGYFWVAFRIELYDDGPSGHVGRGA